MSGHEAGHERERRLERRLAMLDLALERRRMDEPASAEDAEHLQLGVRARLEPAVELEHVAIVEDRRVRLLDAHRPYRAPVRTDAGVRQELPCEPRIAEGVDEAAFGLAEGERVGVVRALGEAHLDERDDGVRRGRVGSDDARALGSRCLVANQRSPVITESSSSLERASTLSARVTTPPPAR